MADYSIPSLPSFADDDGAGAGSGGAVSMEVEPTATPATAPEAAAADAAETSIKIEEPNIKLESEPAASAYNGEDAVAAASSNAAAGAAAGVSPSATSQLDSPDPTHPTLAALLPPAFTNHPLPTPLQIVSDALYSKDRYTSTVSSYHTFLRTKSDLAMLHGATGAYHSLILQQQVGLKRSLPYELVHAYSEREGEIRQAENIYRSLGRPIPQVERVRVFPELVRHLPGGGIAGSPTPNSAGGGGAPSTAKRNGRPPNADKEYSNRQAKEEKQPKEEKHYAAANAAIAAGSGVRTIYGQARMTLHDIPSGNPLLTNTDKASAYADAGHRGSSWSSLAVARSVARKNGLLLPSFPLVYSSFVSSLDTWFSAQDLATRVRTKENSNFITWIECFGYELKEGEVAYEKLGLEVRKDLELQWKEFIWRGIFPQPRTDVWNRHLKRERLRVERDHDNRRMRMVALPGWQRLDTDPPEDKAEDSPIAMPQPMAVQVQPQVQAQVPQATMPAANLSAAAAVAGGVPVGDPAAFQANLQGNPQMMLLMQQMLMMMQQRPAQAPNAGQQMDVVIDEHDTIDGDLMYHPDMKLDAEVERLIDTSDLPPVPIPCPFLPVTSSKVGGKSILYLILSAHLNRFVSSDSVRRLGQAHFPSSWQHFHDVMIGKFPPLTLNPPVVDQHFERHLVKHIITLNQRQEWNQTLAVSEGVRFEAITGMAGSFYRLVEIPEFQRPVGTMTLGERLIATLRAAPAGDDAASNQPTTGEPISGTNVPAAMAVPILPPMPTAEELTTPPLPTNEHHASQATPQFFTDFHPTSTPMDTQDQTMQDINTNQLGLFAEPTNFEPESSRPEFDMQQQ